jgi:hypothetical protein
LSTIQTHDVESFSPNEDDRDLAPNHDQINNHEEPVPSNTLKNVELIIKPAITIFKLVILAIIRRKELYSLPLVKDLHPHERVEDEGRDLFVLAV